MTAGHFVVVTHRDPKVNGNLPIWAATCSLPKPPTERQNRVIGVAAGVPEPLRAQRYPGLDLTAWQA